jgi:hypothetical protein
VPDLQGAFGDQRGDFVRAPLFPNLYGRAFDPLRMVAPVEPGSRAAPGRDAGRNRSSGERHLLLAFKETLHNVVRHAAARRVRIHLSVTYGRFVLEVTDDGRGFDPATVAAGQGLASLRHRAQMLGGEARFQAGPGKGTTVVFTGRFDRISRPAASAP